MSSPRERATVLELKGLSIEFDTPQGVVRAVRGVDLVLHRGEVLGLIGESGSGKTATAMSVLRLTPEPPGRVTGGRILFEGSDIRNLGKHDLRTLRGDRISMIFQDSATSLHPSYTVGRQISEAIKVHNPRIGRRTVRDRAVDLLRSVGIPDPEVRCDQYPHQFSGGMRQRCSVAMAIANNPDIIIADEPTTALDVTIQAEILDLLRTVRNETNAALILITHDLGVVAAIADRVAVMYAGSVVEAGSCDEVFARPRHPYTLALLKSLPALTERMERQQTIKGSPPSPIALPPGCSFLARCDLSQGREVCRSETPTLTAASPGHQSACHFSDELGGSAPFGPQLTVTVPETLPGNRARGSQDAQGRALMRVEGLTKVFSFDGWFRKRPEDEIRAVDGVSFSLFAGRTLALVGESGSGKSTVARLAVGLLKPTAGDITFLGEDLANATREDLRSLRRHIQMVFQDPFGSLNPRKTARQIVAEPLRFHGELDAETYSKVDDLLERVGLDPASGSRRPSAFSGGQRQRIAIARALVLNPQVLVLDEPVSSLDVSIQAQILNLLTDLQTDYGLSFLFISHDLAVVRQLADEIAVMYLGKIVEQGPSQLIYSAPTHPYTRDLLNAVPTVYPVGGGSKRQERTGTFKPSQNAGCSYAPRCILAAEVCMIEEPDLADRTGTGLSTACHFAQPQVIGRAE